MQNTDQRMKEIDRAFELLLLLATVMAATMFQFISSVPYTEEQIALYEANLRFSLGLSLTPIVVTVIIWLPTQLAQRQRRRYLPVRMLAWTYLLSMLIFYGIYTSFLGFANLKSALPWLVAVLIVGILGGFLVRFLQIEYERAINWKAPLTYRILPIVVAVFLAETTILFSLWVI